MATDIRTLYQIFLKAGQVTTDSRHCPEGSIFFALKGERFNGNRYAASALENGCSWAVVDEREWYRPEDSRYILVDDTLSALQYLAAHHRRQMATTVIGITGTNGKTTTKELTAAVLSRGYRILYTEGNLNNQIGVPLTLLRLRKDHQIAIIEMGASHPGDIRELTAISQPDMGLITNVGKAHLLGFGSIDGVLRTKGELYDYLRKEKPEHLVFIDSGNERLMEISRDLRKETYGTGGQAGVRGWVRTADAFLRMSWTRRGADRSWDIDTRLIGAYNLQNVLAAVAVGLHFQIPEEEIVSAIEGYRPSNSRSEMVQTRHNTLIVDAYNANPTSMSASIENFHALKAERKMLILGGMRELGSESRREHEILVDLVRNLGFGDVLLVGSEFSPWKEEFPFFEDAEALAAHLREARPEGWTILLKGSHSVGLSRMTDLL